MLSAASNWKRADPPSRVIQLFLVASCKLPRVAKWKWKSFLSASLFFGSCPRRRSSAAALTRSPTFRPTRELKLIKIDGPRGPLFSSRTSSGFASSAGDEWERTSECSHWPTELATSPGRRNGIEGGRPSRGPITRFLAPIYGPFRSPKSVDPKSSWSGLQCNGRSTAIPIDNDRDQDHSRAPQWPSIRATNHSRRQFALVATDRSAGQDKYASSSFFFIGEPFQCRSRPGTISAARSCHEEGPSNPTGGRCGELCVSGAGSGTLIGPRLGRASARSASGVSCASQAEMS